MSVQYLENSEHLPAKVFEFLKLLVLNAQQTVSKEQAIELVWERNVEVGKRGVGNAIWQLRKTWNELGLDPDDYFKTIPKVGYQLLLPVIELPVTAAVYQQDKRSTSQIVFALIGIIILLGFIFFWRPNSEVQQAVNSEPQRITHYEGVEEQAAISPDGKRMAFLWQRDRKPAQIYIKDLVDQNAPLRQVSMSEYSEESPTWSPDNQSLAYLQIKDNDECSIRIRDLISNQDREIDTGCAKLGFRRNLSWSPDGKKLVYIKSTGDQKAVFSTDLDSNKVKQVSIPDEEIQDVLIEWSADSEQLLYIREREMSAELVMFDFSTDETSTLPYARDMVIGLAWQHKKNELYATALKEGSFVIEKLNLDDFSTTEFHRDNTISSLTLNKAGTKLYYSNHIGQEFITVRDITTGAIHSQVISSSRDLFGQQLKATNEILYVSNRNGNWELWSKKNGQNLMLTDDVGLVSLPSVSPVDSQFIVLIKPKGNVDYQLYLGDRRQNQLQSMPEFEGKNIKYPSFSSDGENIVFSVMEGSNWIIQSYNLDDKSFTQLHSANARYTVQTEKGLYFSKENHSGLFHFNFVTNEETLLIPELSKGDWGSFFVHGNEIFYVARTKEKDLLQKRNLDGMTETLFELPAKSIRTGRAIAKGADGQVIVSMLGINDADIFELELNVNP
ncbi:PD40 domain-containing protein [Shewanella sp. 202IG2-18]|uniref:winged helix-turn-helix domain-containing protein n=1 Tax=Parashewanella hymeniacidonis TaxID=2807618 RepID=UPI0019614C91|nr:winged helix-turn-helix domain-containing protein [Parashewanella hymeniacidonis]MBM7070469.1 PD40 domain-containing protein [Parashewanella hymeniacidonis]